MNEAKFIQQLIRRAQRGDAEAGREALRAIVYAIDAGQFDSPLFPYLAECLALFDDGVPLDRALNVEGGNAVGRRPYKHIEIAAVDILLRHHAGKRPEQANAWIGDAIGADRTTVQKIRRDHKPMESLSRDDLLHLAGDMRENLAGVLPQT